MEQSGNFVELLLCRRHCVGAVHILYLLYSLQPDKRDVIICRNLRSRKVKWLAQSHPAILWQRQNSNLGLSGSSVCSSLCFGSPCHRLWVGQSSSSIPLRAGAHIKTMDDSSSSVSLVALRSTPSPSRIEMNIFSITGRQMHPVSCPQSISEMELSICTRKKPVRGFGGVWLLKSKYFQTGGLRQQSVTSLHILKEFELQLCCFLFEFCREGESVIRHALFLQIDAEGWLSSFLLKAVLGSTD